MMSRRSEIQNYHQHQWRRDMPLPAPSPVLYCAPSCASCAQSCQCAHVCSVLASEYGLSQHLALASGVHARPWPCDSSCAAMVVAAYSSEDLPPSLLASLHHCWHRCMHQHIDGACCSSSFCQLPARSCSKAACLSVYSDAIHH